MSLPINPNTTCDIYHNGTPGPPGAPDIAGVACFLRPDFAGGHRHVAEAANYPDYRWTHTLLVALTVDIRDDYTTGLPGGTHDLIYIPDKNGSAFKVRFVERVGRGTAADHKRVYLDRQLPTWPTNDL